MAKKISYTDFTITTYIIPGTPGGMTNEGNVKGYVFGTDGEKSLF